MGGTGARVFGTIHEAQFELRRDKQLAQRSADVNNRRVVLGGHVVEHELDDFLYISESEQALSGVLDALKQAGVDTCERKILWADGARLSVEETARRIHSEFDSPLDMIQRHVVGWLQMIYEPEGLDEDEMEEFERLIEEWTTPYEDLN